MHELSIAASIVDLAEEEAERRAVRVVAIHLTLGALSGVVRAHVEAKKLGFPLIIGSQMRVGDMLLVALATNRNGYGNLSELITLGSPCGPTTNGCSNALGSPHPNSGGPWAGCAGWSGPLAVSH